MSESVENQQRGQRLLIVRCGILDRISSQDIEELRFGEAGTAGHRKTLKVLARWDDRYVCRRRVVTGRQELRVG
jgi:hypothetical protein